MPKRREPIQSPKWSLVLSISCLIAVSVDPFFFYLPIINEKSKCVGLNKNLWTIALLLRAITDIAFILNIFYQISSVAKKIRPNRQLPWHTIIIGILAVLPIPQVLVSVLLKMRSSRYIRRRNIINVLLVGQYLPRIYQTHHAAWGLRHSKGPWISTVFYFSMYIMASHVFGAFWYFFSIQRETACWQQVCIKHGISECRFYCDEDVSSRNMTFVNSLEELCLVDVPTNSTKPFDFGIFLDFLTSGVTGQVSLKKKFLYSFWWGLRNLSNFGTNLETSTYELEIFFVILISIIGLLLFVYLIGNVQSAILMKNEMDEKKRRKLFFTSMDISAWMARNYLTAELMNQVEPIVKQNIEEIKGADMEGLFGILPRQTQTSLKRFLCIGILKKVPFPFHKNIEPEPEKGTIQEEILLGICDLLQPVIYPDNCFVFRMGEPLDRMLLITQGLVLAYNGDAGTGATYLRRGAFYGEKLLTLASEGFKFLDNVPMTEENVKSHGKVEGFIIMAKDLKTVADKYKLYWLYPDPSARETAACRIIIKAFRNYKATRQWRPWRI